MGDHFPHWVKIRVYAHHIETFRVKWSMFSGLGSAINIDALFPMLRSVVFIAERAYTMGA